MSWSTVEGKQRKNPPDWAVRQRNLIDVMDRAVRPFVEQCTRPDGTLIWRSKWTSMDGTDNGYESFLSFPLFYILGGGEHIQDLAQKELDALTRQFTNYGTVDRDFVTGFDWFHHSESYTYTFYMAMSDPYYQINRERAIRFAAMYMGEDSSAQNWDSELKMIRSPLNGSNGPRFVTTKVDWDYHRPILAKYLAPYEDMAGVDQANPLSMVDWTDDEVFDRVLTLINQRMTRGDVPLNLSAACMITHAFLYTGEGKYRDWVLDYLQVWKDRRDRNGGIVPDNVGPNGAVGELMQGKWWGGYYGWRWPHGAKNIVEPAYVAGSCAVLLTGDFSHLDLCRSQLDMIWEKRIKEDGVTKVPYRHGDTGWFDFRPADPYFYIHLSYLSQQEEDRSRLEEVFPGLDGFEELPADWGRFKAGRCPPNAWYSFMEGKNPDYPRQVIESTYHCICEGLDRLENDESDPEERECTHFQPLNPVLPEALIQMSMGTPAAVYNGGLLQAHVRYFDPLRKRAGLPEHISALVDKVKSNGLSVTLVNTDPVESHSVLLQSGSFGEHEFTDCRRTDNDGASQSIEVHARHLEVRLEAGAQVQLQLGFERFKNHPSYDFPF